MIGDEAITGMARKAHGSLMMPQAPVALSWRSGADRVARRVSGLGFHARNDAPVRVRGKVLGHSVCSVRRAALAALVRGRHAANSNRELTLKGQKSDLRQIIEII